VIYNYQRWFSCNGGKIIFCAPMLASVTEQLVACFHISGISIDSIAQMSKKIKTFRRMDIWSSHSVFFFAQRGLS